VSTRLGHTPARATFLTESTRLSLSLCISLPPSISSLPRFVPSYLLSLPLSLFPYFSLPSSSAFRSRSLLFRILLRSLCTAWYFFFPSPFPVLAALGRFLVALPRHFIFGTPSTLRARHTLASVSTSFLAFSFYLFRYSLRNPSFNARFLPFTFSFLIASRTVSSLCILFLSAPSRLRRLLTCEICISRRFEFIALAVAICRECSTAILKGEIARALLPCCNYITARRSRTLHTCTYMRKML